jgi:hypothetical protein
MINVELYIEGQRVDLFKDEQISLNLSVKNYQNLDKVFTDFTQTFTIPASETNNVILEHWYDKSVTTSFNPATKLEARIELNSIPFRRGLVKVNEAVFKGDQIDFYKITFFGANTNLTKLFGEDYLHELNLSAYDLEYADFNTAIANRVQSDNVLIPLISPERNWRYNTDTDGDSIKWVDTNSTGIEYIEMKAAIRLARIIDAIETKYSITINSSFFAGADFLKLYMWAHREAGNNRNFAGNYTKQDTVSSTSPNPSPYYDVANQWFVIPSSLPTATATFQVAVTGYGVNADTTPVDIVLYDANAGEILQEYSYSSQSIWPTYTVDRPGVGEPDIHLVIAFRTPDLDTIDFVITSTIVTLNGQQLIQPDVSPFAFTNFIEADTLTGESRSYRGNLPNQKVSEFLSGLIKMFNLVVIPVSETEFDIEPLDDYYSVGTDANLTKYVHSNTKTVKPASLYGEIDFMYSGSKSILADNFKKTNNIGYGDLKSVILDSNNDPLSSETFKITLPFINFLWERLVDETDSNAVLAILVAKSFDENFKPLIEKPYIFYYVERVTPSRSIAIKQASGLNAAQLTTYNLCFQYNTSGQSFTKALNFGQELNPYTSNSVSQSTASLYNDYWATYIEGLYNSQQRKTTLKATLPMSVLIDLELNQTLIIGFNKYRINAMQVDLTTGETELDLLNIIA